MSPRIIHNLEEFRGLAGQELGISPWLTVDQSRIDAFADCTLDRQWIHCDAGRAARQSPYGATIAHGFLTLSLAPALLAQCFTVQGLQMVINYGLNRVRFPAALRCGQRLRLKCRLLEVQELPGGQLPIAPHGSGLQGVEAVLGLTLEGDGQEKPVCVAELVLRLLS
jgi:acyl dehydratase